MPTYLVEIVDSTSSSYKIEVGGYGIHGAFNNYFYFKLKEKVTGAKSEELMSIRVTVTDSIGTTKIQEY